MRRWRALVVACGLAAAMAGCASSGDVIVEDRSISAETGRPYSPPPRPRDDFEPRSSPRGDVATDDGAVETMPVRDEPRASGATATPLRDDTRAPRATSTPRRNEIRPIRSTRVQLQDEPGDAGQASPPIRDLSSPSSYRDEPRDSARPAEAPPVREHVIAPGDTIYGVAFRNGLDYRALAVWNDIDPPYTIKLGQRLRLTPPTDAGGALATAPASASSVTTATTMPPPATPSPSPRPDATPVLASTPPTPADATGGLSLPPNVEPLGDAPVAPRDPTLPPPSSPPISTTASTSVPAVTATAPVTTPSRPATTPPSGAVSAAIAGTPRPAAPPPIAAPSVPATAPTTTATLPPPSVTPGAIVDTGPSQTVAGIRWRWPARGALVGRFTAGDAARQGIDVQGTLGQAVVAAADGEVVYSGNGLLGYGELVIIKHSPEFLSAYGYNRRRHVREGERVKAGQTIAEMGQTGAALSIVHFEIRQAGKPVDPLRFLPRR